MTIEGQVTVGAERPGAGPQDRAGDRLIANTISLELCFIVVVGLIVAAAFVSALRYDFVSARAPLFIMVPLLILIGVQFMRVKAQARRVDVGDVLSAVARGKNKGFNRVGGFIGWMVLLLVLIVVAGHYIGIAALMFILLRIISKENIVVSLAITAGVTIIIFFLFEYGFDIELHRGLIYRIWAGYN